MALDAADQRWCLSISICTIHIDLATVKQIFHALEIALLTGDMNRPPTDCCLRTICTMIDEQRQALCVTILAGSIYWGSTCIIDRVQLGAVVDEQGQALTVAIRAGNRCWGNTINLPVPLRRTCCALPTSPSLHAMHSSSNSSSVD